VKRIDCSHRGFDKIVKRIDCSHRCFDKVVRRIDCSHRCFDKVVRRIDCSHRGFDWVNSQSVLQPYQNFWVNSQCVLQSYQNLWYPYKGRYMHYLEFKILNVLIVVLLPNIDLLLLIRKKTHHNWSTFLSSFSFLCIVLYTIVYPFYEN
jgi:hypothetical protein